MYRAHWLNVALDMIVESIRIEANKQPTAAGWLIALNNDVSDIVRLYMLVGFVFCSGSLQESFGMQLLRR